MSLIISGASSQTLGMDHVKSVLLSSSSGNAEVVITNTSSVVVLNLNCGANSAVQWAMPGQVGGTFHFDRNSTVSVTGSGAFLRID